MGTEQATGWNSRLGEPTAWRAARRSRAEESLSSDLHLPQHPSKGSVQWRFGSTHLDSLMGQGHGRDVLLIHQQSRRVLHLADFVDRDRLDLWRPREGQVARER